MTNASSLDTLLKLAYDRLEQAGTQLREAVAAQQRAQQQLQQLQDYRLDYQQRAQQTQKNGLTASNYRNFAQFLGTLDQAISLQNKAVAQSDAKAQHARQLWMQQKRQCDAYETLQTRRAQQVQQREKRREQRQSDEFARSRPAM